MDVQLALLEPQEMPPEKRPPTGPSCPECGSHAGVYMLGVFVCSVCPAGKTQNALASQRYRANAARSALRPRRSWPSRRRR